MSENSKIYLWGGRILTALPVLMLTMSAGMKIAGPEDFLKTWTSMGFKAEQAMTIGLLELVCTMLYAFPRTAGLGAVLLTGYLGGAVVVHVKLGDSPLVPIVLGILLWGGLYFRDDRVRALLPLRKA